MMTASCFRQIDRFTLFVMMGIIAVFSTVLPLSAQSVPVPKFFDQNERFEQPNLAALLRLRFLTTIHFPPFNYIDRDGRLAGYNIDLIRALCSELKVENICQIEVLPWDELVARLESSGGEAVIAGLAPTAGNRIDLIFSHPYMRFSARFIGLRNVVPSQPFPVWLRSRRVGVAGRTAHEKILSSYFPDVRMVAFDDHEQLYQAIRSQIG